MKKSAITKKVILFFILLLLSLFSLVVVRYIKDIDNVLPDPERLVQRDLPTSTIIYDRNSIELYRFFSGDNREFVSIDDVPSNVKWSLIASEDSNYYEHEGFNIISTIKCFGVTALNKVLGKSGSCGGSTITQQLVRNTILADEYGKAAFERGTLIKTIDRKVKEILSAYRVDSKYSKDQILQLYINEVPLGGVNYGLQTASRAYFDKTLKELTLGETATLIGFIQKPSSINPVISDNYDLYEFRRNYVLDQLARNKEKYGVTSEEIEKAKNEKIVFKSKQFPIKAPHFIAYIKEELTNKYGNDFLGKGLKVYTSLDYRLQKIAEDDLKTSIDSVSDKLYIFNGGVVALSPKTNQVLAMVGSTDFWRKSNEVSGNINTTRNRILLGSSVKPYTYITAFEQGYGPWLLTPDIPGEYLSLNADAKYQGLISANTALVESRNVSARYVEELVGRKNLTDTYKKLELPHTEEIKEDGPHLTLGSFPTTLLDHTNAFNIFPSEGSKAKLTSILKVTDNQNNVLEDKSNQKEERIFSNDDVYQINWILCRQGTENPGKLFNIDGKTVLCGKTGTSGEPRTLTSMYYHKNLMLGVWTGNTDGTEISKSIFSYYITSPIAVKIMTDAKDIYIPEGFERPLNVKDTTICTDTGSIKGNLPCPTEKTIYKIDSKLDTDKREITWICKETGTQAISTQLFNLSDYTIEKINLNKTLELSTKQDLYNSFVKTTNEKYINGILEKKDCPLKPEESITATNNGSSYTKLPYLFESPVEKATFKQEDDIPVKFVVYDPSIGYVKDYTKFKIVINNPNEVGEISILEGDLKPGIYMTSFKASKYLDPNKNYFLPVNNNQYTFIITLYLTNDSGKVENTYVYRSVTITK